MNVLFGRLSPCHCDEGEEYGDDGFLVMPKGQAPGTRHVVDDACSHCEISWLVLLYAKVRKKTRSTKFCENKLLYLYLSVMPRGQETDII